MLFRCIVADPPWSFSDSLTMADTKRGASSNYDTLSIEDLKNLPVKDLCEDDAVLVLWVPSSLLSEGLEVMKAWGFRQTQTIVWVKTKKESLKNLHLKIVPVIQNLLGNKKSDTNILKGILNSFSLSSILGFGMGRLFRQTHELAIVGVRGKIYGFLQNKSQRSVHFFPSTKHSTKPEALQDMLDVMFPGSKKLELFARRDRSGWICAGNECPSTISEDIRDSIDRLKKACI